MSSPRYLLISSLAIPESLQLTILQAYIPVPTCRVKVDSNGKDTRLEAFSSDGQTENGGGDICLPGEHMRPAQQCRSNIVDQQCCVEKPARLGTGMAAAN